MAVQSEMNAVVSALRSAIGNDKKQKATLNKIRDAFKAVEANELPRSEMVERSVHLVNVISESVANLYKTRPRPTLAFCAVAMRWLFKAKLEPTLKGGDEEDAKVWEDTIFRGLLQPILSIIDSEDQDLDLVGNTIYGEICGIMRSPWSQGFGGRFARSLALVLVCTCSSSSNKAMLLDSAIFGTDTLSKLIIDAKDYHHLDTLLELSFTMFSSQGGKMTRKTYAGSIFGSGYALEKLPDDISNELASIHSVTNGDNSEKHVLDIMRTMSRAGIERQVIRPQVFMTKDFSYCGTRFTQMPPSNVVILDHKNLCIVFCDKNAENDVLVVATEAVESVELIPQGISRIIVELVVAEPPLISSSREDLAMPDSHIPGSPLKIRLSIASSDIIGLEAALAARDLSRVLRDDNALTRHSSLASLKISNAVFSVPLGKNTNPNNEQAEDMIRKYVNLPSSRDGSSPPPVERNKATTRSAQSKSLPSGAPIVSTTKNKLVAPPQTKKPRDEPSVTPRPADEPTSRPSVSTPVVTTPVKPAGPATTRNKRTAAEKSQKAIKLAALAELDGSELTDTDPGTPSEQPGKQMVVKTPAEVVPALPTPPRTRARNLQTKPAAKTLVPATPPAKDIPQVSSPPDVPSPSPSPKPSKKRKLVEDDPFGLPPLKPERPTKQKKIEDTNVPSNSQHIQPRDTAATRAKAKYGAISKRMRASSPIESIHSADTDGDDSPQKKAPTATKGKKGKGAQVKTVATTEVQPRSKNDKPEAPKRQTRAGVANAKSKPIAETTGITENKAPKSSAALATQTKAIETSEPIKKRGRPPKNKSTQQPIKLPEPPSKEADPIEQTSSQLAPCDTPGDTEPICIDEADTTEPVPTTITPEMTVVTQEEAPEDDDLLERLSQAAKKALKPAIVDHRPTMVSHRSPSPVKTPEIKMEQTQAIADTLEPPVQGLDTLSPEGISHQTRNMTPKLVDTLKTQATQPLGAGLEKSSGSNNASTATPTERPDAPESGIPKPKNPRAAQTPTELRIPKDGGRNETPMDSIRAKKPAPASARLTRNTANKATHQPDPKPTTGGTRTEALALTPQEPKIVASLENLDHLRPVRITERIQSETTQVIEAHTPVRQVQTPPAKDTRRIKFPPVFISADSDVEMEPSQEPALPQAKVESIRRLSVPTPTTRPGVNSQLYPAPSAKIKHAAVTRVLSNASTQPSPKSALASPQRRKLANGTRPSVSFLEPPAPLSRRGSSSSSNEGTQNQRAYRCDRKNLREGHSAHTADVILQITDVMTEIQEVVALNLGGKIQTINAEARSARVELTKSIIEELDNMKAESDFHHDVLHKFESTFASQVRAMLEGLGRVVECNDRMNAGIGDILTANARAGQGIAKNALDFQVPEVFGAFLAS